MKMPTNAYSPLLIISGLLLWASSFVVLYATLSLGCVYAWSPGVIRTVLVLLWLAHLALLGILIVYFLCAFRHAGQPKGRFTSQRFGWCAAVLVALVGLVSTAWTGLPILAVTPCI